MDILCQAKSGMGKTAVFVLATLQQLELTENRVHVLVMCHTRELAFQISKEYERFSKYMPHVKVSLRSFLNKYIIAVSKYLRVPFTTALIFLFRLVYFLVVYPSKKMKRS